MHIIDGHKVEVIPEEEEEEEEESEEEGEGGEDDGHQYVVLEVIQVCDYYYFRKGTYNCVTSKITIPNPTKKTFTL